MTDFTIIEARPWHCGAMSRLLRVEHQRAVAQIGIDSHRELRARFDQSSYRRAWMIDGRLAALGGVTGSAISPDGFVWLAFSQGATRYPLAMIKEARRQLAEIGITKRRLFTSIWDADEASKRFAIFVGFVPDDGEGGRAETRFGRREMIRRSDAISRGDVPGISMLYDMKAA